MPIITSAGRVDRLRRAGFSRRAVRTASRSCHGRSAGRGSTPVARCERKRMNTESGCAAAGYRARTWCSIDPRGSAVVELGLEARGWARSSTSTTANCDNARNEFSSNRSSIDPGARAQTPSGACLLRDAGKRGYCGRLIQQRRGGVVVRDRSSATRLAMTSVSVTPTPAGWREISRSPPATASTKKLERRILLLSASAVT